MSPRSTTTPTRRGAVSSTSSRRTAASAAGSALTGTVAGAREKWQPAGYQLDGVKFLLDQPQGLLALRPGLRKTSIVLAAFKLQRKAGVVRKMLVVSTPRIIGRTGPWHGEVARWKDFEGLRVVTLHGPKKERLLEQDADIYLVSYEGLEWLFDVRKVRSPKTGKVQVVPNFAKVKKLGVDLLVLDEVTKVKRAAAQRSKVVLLAQDHFARVVGMSGSPRPRDVEDLFGIMLVIDGGYSLGRYITHFRNAFMYPSGYGGYDWKLRDGADKEIDRKVAPFVFRVDHKGLVDIPEVVINPVVVDLPDEARRVYDELEEEFITEVMERGLEKVVVLAQNSGGAWVRCAQVANGGFFLPGELEEATMSRGAKRWVDLHGEKVQATVDLLESLDGEPAMVVYDFAHDLARLQAGTREAFGEAFPHIGGGVTARQADRLVEQWNTGRLRGLLVHPASVSHGLNMQGDNAQHVVWHSLTANFEHFEQLNARLARSGNRSAHVFAHLVIAKDTVDEAKYKTLRLREAEQGRFLDAMRDYTEARFAKYRKARRSA